jgi:hypothetical protein
MIDNARHSQKPLRFKFMPSPNAMLHVGHAWILFVTDALIRAAHREGREADLVIVFDEILARWCGRNSEEIELHCNGILQDLKYLGIEFAKTCSNYEMAGKQDKWNIFFESVGDGTPRSMRPPYLESSALVAPDYFLLSARIDAGLGVTHMLRGCDQICHAVTYLNFYQLLNVPLPCLTYLPLIHDSHGEKVSSSASALPLHKFPQHITAERLLGHLVSCCIEMNEPLSVGADTNVLHRAILGEDWSFIFGNEKWRETRLNFLSRFIARPRVNLDQLFQTKMPSF